ncbi:MAG: nucleotide exchange factor GrpE [Myxococcota bacterium]|nr:nucleotide exchange factor GrpE [Myxococcota bacterium]
MTPRKKKSEGAKEAPNVEPGEQLAEALREASEAVGDEEAAGEGPALDPEPGDEDELAGARRELEEAGDRFMRLQAEFENFRRRSLKERQESLQYGHQNLVKDLLATVDNLERALAHSEEDASADMESVVQGVELVKRELLGALGKHGVKVIEPLKEEAFDPAFHEAMGQLPDGSVEPNSVLEVLQKGYMINDRMLRPARVLLAREPGEKEEPVPPDDGADKE